MGFKLLSRVYSEIRNTSPTEQAILAYLAFRASDETKRCFPSRNAIEDATHFGQTAINNGLNGLHEKEILQWVRGGRKPKGRGFSLANEYSFNFPKLSTELSTKLSTPQALDDTICREAAPIINNHNKKHPSVIKGAPSGQEPMENVVRQESIEIGRAWSAHTQTPTVPKRPPSLIQRAMEICGVSDRDNYLALVSVMMKKSRSQCEDEIFAFESELRQGEHKNIRNRTALLMSRLKQLPDLP